MLFLAPACLSNPCNSNGLCEDISTGYICNCFVGYTGQNCQRGMS